jgi:hypothetical protein
MLGEIGYLHMTAGACILTVNGSGELRSGYLVAVTTETGGRIDGHSLFSRRNAGKSNDKKDDRDDAGNQLHENSPEMK